jgi:hypothetical protein
MVVMPQKGVWRQDQLVSGRLAPLRQGQDILRRRWQETYPEDRLDDDLTDWP